MKSKMTLMNKNSLNTQERQMELTGQGKLLPSLGEGFRVKIRKSTLLELLSITLPQPQKKIKKEFKQALNI